MDVIDIIKRNGIQNESKLINRINKLIIERAVNKCADIFKPIDIDKNKIYNEYVLNTDNFKSDQNINYIYDLVKRNIINQITINIIRFINQSEENMLYKTIDKLAKDTKLTDRTNQTFEWYYEQE